MQLKKYEYKFVALEKFAPREAVLNKLGADGWEFKFAYIWPDGSGQITVILMRTLWWHARVEKWVPFTIDPESY